MNSYDVPSFDYDSATPEAAQGEIGKLNAAITIDAEHPCLNNNHPQRKEFLDHRQKLYTIVANHEAEQAETRDEEMAYKIEHHFDEKQHELTVEAEGEVMKLAALGYTSSEVPEDISPVDVQLLRAQRYGAEGDFDKAQFEVEQVLRSVKSDPETVTAMRSFASIKSMDKAGKSEILDTVLKVLHRNLKGSK